MALTERLLKNIYNIFAEYKEIFGPSPVKERPWKQKRRNQSLGLLTADRNFIRGLADVTGDAFSNRAPLSKLNVSYAVPQVRVRGGSISLPNVAPSPDHPSRSPCIFCEAKYTRIEALWNHLEGHLKRAKGSPLAYPRQECKAKGTVLANPILFKAQARGHRVSFRTRIKLVQSGSKHFCRGGAGTLPRPSRLGRGSL